MSNLKWTLFWMCYVWIFQAMTEANRNGTVVYKKGRPRLLNPYVKVCYGKLGCFWNGPPFQHPFWRPISVPPLPPELQKTLFFLYTRSNVVRPFLVSPLHLDAALTSHLRPRTPTRIIIPEAVDGVLISNWMKDLKNQYLTLADENVILVDYGTRTPLTFWNAANARVVGAQIGELIHFLHERCGIPGAIVHLIGHGLGAHIAGYAGERQHGLGRITGFGTPEDLGHVNFFAAGGKRAKCIPQRTLATGATPLEFLQNALFCSHFRSIDFFLSSFDQKGCLFVGVECSSYEDFYVGRCNCGSKGQKCRFMGHFATGAPYETRYYLMFDNKKPYCVHQYQVIVYIELPYLHKTYGSLPVSADLVVAGGRNFRQTFHFRVNLREQRQFRTFLLTLKQPVGQIDSAVAVVQLPEQRYNISVSLAAVEINYLFPVPKREISNVLCKETETLSSQGQQVLLTSSACHTLIETADRSNEVQLS
ncbi:pancreatic triacylglycerol lipase-like isoform X2 [Argiope bruennichi]|uniref:pancreatic triacylglycerol lipase-like isoform X2 n=1 Tax=Argiope bruennichi TaxID=94029 RepID=UPI002494A1C5|nr:pancreatic triacylglycerol lipase-like isoform X2 [Argiope bruennichi]